VDGAAGPALRPTDARSDMISYVLQGFVFGFAAAVQPGPLQAYIILQTINYGWRRTIMFAIVPILSDLPIIVIVVFILAEIPALWVVALRLVGGVFLLYLAVNAIRSVGDMEEVPGAEEESRPRGLPQAVMINLLNPNPYLFWGLVTGPILLTGWRESPWNGIGLVAGFYTTLILFNALIILLVSSARRLSPELRRILVICSAVGLAVFGAYQILQGAAAVWPA
jgi:threonine/homoserine/homoserine lactone efflux protein